MNEFLVILERFGFAAVAFGCMFWMCNSALAKNTAAINRLALIIQMLKDKING